nr:hypothetical protein Iba_chr05aCG9000 [Ipomoea batatas]
MSPQLLSSLDRKSKSSPLAISPVGVPLLTASLPSPELPLTASLRLTTQSLTLTGHCFGLGSSVSQAKVFFSRFHFRLSRIQSLIVQIPYTSRSPAGRLHNFNKLFKVIFNFYFSSLGIKCTVLVIY